jgi:hypothetical protein
MPQIPAIGLVVVSGGIAQDYAPPHVDIRIIDIDNIKAGDEKAELPRDVGFEELVKTAGVEEFVTYFDPD